MRIRHRFVIFCLCIPLVGHAQYSSPRTTRQIDNRSQAYGLKAPERQFSEYMLLIDRAAQRNDLSTVNRLYEEMEQQWVRSSRLCFNWGNTLFEMGYLKLAIAKYKEATILDKDYANAFYNMATAYFQLHEYRAALLNYRMAALLKPEDLKIRKAIGQSYEAMGEHSLAIREYRAIGGGSKSEMIVYHNRANDKLNKGETQQSKKNFQKALSLESRNAQAYYGWGCALFREGDYRGSIQKFEQAIALRPNYATAYSNMAAAYLNIEEYERSLAAYLSSLEIEPEDTTSFYYSDQILIRLRQVNPNSYQAGVRRFQKIIRQNLNNYRLNSDLTFKTMKNKYL